MENKDIILEKAKDGNWTCKIKVDDKWKYMYSKYTTKKYINNICKNSNYIVLGLGLGYELKQIIENTSGMVYVVDKDETFYNLMKELNLLGEIINNNRIKFFFGEEYKKINLDNYIIYNNENITQIYMEFYYKVVKYFTQKNSSNVKKKIAFYEHVTIADDCIDAFKNLGFDVVKLNFSIVDKMIQDLINVNPDYIFSINLSEKICEASKKLSLPYISWTVDVPAYSLYGDLLKNEKIIAFVCDYKIMKNLLNKGIRNVFYMPVAANVERLDKIKISLTDLKKYSCEVSFLGSTDIDNDFNKYIENLLSNETNLEIQEILKKQFLNENEFIIKDIVNDGLVDKIKNETEYNIVSENFLNGKEKLAILLGRKFNQIQRVNMIKTLSKIFNFYVYGDENWSDLHDSYINYRGYAEHFSQMPKVFKCSKININYTRVYVESGLPMRVFDILGSRGFLLTNHKEDIDKYFIDGRDLIVYRDIKDLVEIIEYYLNNEDERQKIILNGYEKVKNEHTYEKRLKEIMEITNKYFNLQ